MQYTVIDVREPEEYQSSHVAGALNIPPDQLMKGAAKLDGVPKDSAIIVYCRTGSRSNVAMNILKSLGFTDITNGINKEQVEAKFDIH
ncbi:MAG: rhodanese-like domain-containing protein [Patescibacteria group bacterium]|nr:rhodanese-like domain-containing protein [Patescibacteria group bacterium]